MSLSAACRLLGMSRQAFYQKEKRQRNRVRELCQVKDLVVSERRFLPRAGTRKLLYLLKTELQQRHIKLGRDGLFSFLRSEHLLIGRKKSYTKTTFSKHWLHKHPNLVEQTVPLRAEQIWVSDITYVATTQGQAYVSLITDAYSRKIVGYHTSEDLGAASVSQALEMAITTRKTSAPLIHHSDRGIQYCSALYQQILSREQITPSMTDGYDCYQNALAERVNGILKEEFLLQTYQDAQQLQKVVAQSVDLYNKRRPHLSLNYLTPDQVHEKSLMDQLNQGP